MLAESGPWWQTLFRNTDALVLICIFGTAILVVAVTSIAHCWHAIAKARVDADLKHSMIERGMSAEEIERILRAKSTEK